MKRKQTNKKSMSLKPGLWKNKQDRPLAQLTKRKKEELQINSITDENGNITTDKEDRENHMRILQKCIFY